MRIAIVDAGAGALAVVLWIGAFVFGVLLGALAFPLRSMGRPHAAPAGAWHGLNRHVPGVRGRRRAQGFGEAAGLCGGRGGDGSRSHSPVHEGEQVRVGSVNAPEPHSLYAHDLL